MDLRGLLQSAELFHPSGSSSSGICDEMPEAGRPARRIPRTPNRTFERSSNTSAGAFRGYQLTKNDKVILAVSLVCQADVAMTAMRAKRKQATAMRMWRSNHISILVCRKRIKSRSSGSSPFMLNRLVYGAVSELEEGVESAFSLSPVPCLAVCPSFYPSIDLSINPSIHPSVPPSIHPSIHPSLYLSLSRSLSLSSSISISLSLQYDLKPTLDRCLQTPGPPKPALAPQI